MIIRFRFILRSLKGYCYGNPTFLRQITNIYWYHLYCISLWIGISPCKCARSPRLWCCYIV